MVKEKAGAGFVDAPMSGGVVGAHAGTLTFMVGAEKEDMPKIEKILLLMGKKVWHMGPRALDLAGNWQTTTHWRSTTSQLPRP